MNMKQSCKALICAIEGELDGRHCTEEQAAAILDHALPSLTEALARVEAERDALKFEKATAEGKMAHRIFTAQAQLAEAVGLLRKANSWISGMRWPGYDLAERHEGLITELEAFLARHAQAEQQEAQSPMAKMAEALQQKAADEWESHPSNPANQEAQGAQAGDEAEPAVSFAAWMIDHREGQAVTEEDMQAWLAEWYEARAALATQPAAIKLPERRPIDQKDNFRRGCAHGFNACLIAVSRLNAVRGAEQ